MDVRIERMIVVYIFEKPEVIYLWWRSFDVRVSYSGPIGTMRGDEHIMIQKMQGFFFFFFHSSNADFRGHWPSWIASPSEGPLWTW